MAFRGLFPGRRLGEIISGKDYGCQWVKPGLMGWVVGSTHKSQVFCLPFFCCSWRCHFALLSLFFPILYPSFTLTEPVISFAGLWCLGLGRVSCVVFKTLRVFRCDVVLDSRHVHKKTAYLPPDLWWLRYGGSLFKSRGFLLLMWYA